MPSKQVASYNEIKFYLDMGWIKLYREDNEYEPKRTNRKLSSI